MIKIYRKYIKKIIICQCNLHILYVFLCLKYLWEAQFEQALAYKSFFLTQLGIKIKDNPRKSVMANPRKGVRPSSPISILTGWPRRLILRLLAMTRNILFLNNFF
jgi:hypothetical protein